MPAIFPDKTYLNTSILTICNYSISKGLISKIISSNKEEITIEQLVDRYYNGAEDYFTLIENTSPKTDLEIEYMQNGENRVESQENSENNTESITPETKLSEKLFDSGQSNNLSIFPNIDPEPKPRPQATCHICGYTDDAFYMKNHRCEGND